LVRVLSGFMCTRGRLGSIEFTERRTKSGRRCYSPKVGCSGDALLDVRQDEWSDELCLDRELLWDLCTGR
jgi:hypothetical protein